MPLPQPFQYQGSKWALAALILWYLPAGMTQLVEPFCGSAADYGETGMMDATPHPGPLPERGGEGEANGGGTRAREFRNRQVEYSRAGLSQKAICSVASTSCGCPLTGKLVIRASIMGWRRSSVEPTW